MSGKLAGKRVALYARYSSDQQRETSIEDQLRRCREFVVQNGGTVDERMIFTDSATSGATMDRAGVRKLQFAVDAGVLDAIVAEDTSRVSRDLADSASLYKKLRYREVVLYGVADGVDTSAPNAKINYAVKSLLSDMYLDDLADKTKRGQEGRWLAGFSTGSPPIGYRSEPVPGANGRPVGYRILIDDKGAAIVRRVFELYDDGHSLSEIARRFNVEHVPPPRAKTQHRRKGWIASSVREILANEAYIGKWTWRKRRWVRDPDSGRRVPRSRAETEVQRKEFPDRRIIDQQLWDRVRARAAGVAEKYDGKGKRGTPGNKTVYPLSGVLICAKCKAPMTIMRGTSASYYACSDRRKRGTCDNKLSVREELARTCLFRAIRDALFTPEAIEYLRKRIAERLGELSRTATAELRERTERISRTKARLDNIVAFVAEGNRFETLGTAIKDLEAQLKADRAALAALKERAAAPVALPTPEAILQRAQDLDRVFKVDPTALRVKLLRFFERGQVLLEPQPDGTYVAMSTLLPLVVLAETKEPAIQKPRVPSLSSNCCAGRI